MTICRHARTLTFLILLSLSIVAACSEPGHTTVRLHAEGGDKRVLTVYSARKISELIFHVRNTTDKRLSSPTFKKSCSCFDVEVIPDFVAPGDLATIKVLVEVKPFATRTITAAVSWKQGAMAILTGEVHAPRVRGLHVWPSRIDAWALDRARSMQIHYIADFGARYPSASTDLADDLHSAQLRIQEAGVSIDNTMLRVAKDARQAFGTATISVSSTVQVFDLPALNFEFGSLGKSTISLR